MDVNMFKICTMCGKQWRTRNDFLVDSGLETIGYQPDFTGNCKGLFLFNHTCGTTLSVAVLHFTDLIEGLILNNVKAGKSTCPKLYLNEKDISLCSEFCTCAEVRKIIPIINSFK